DRADDRVHRYRLQPQRPFAAPAERADELVERHYAAVLTAPAAQAAGQRGQDLALPGPQEGGLGGCPREPGIWHRAVLAPIGSSQVGVRPRPAVTASGQDVAVTAGRPGPLTLRGTGERS